MPSSSRRSSRSRKKPKLAVLLGFAQNQRRIFFCGFDLKVKVAGAARCLLWAGASTCNIQTAKPAVIGWKVKRKAGPLDFYFRHFPSPV